MIEIRELVKTFDGFAALDGASLTVPQGAIYGLVGPNGAGKSTLLRHLTGVYRQDSGTVSVDGADVWENVAVKQRIASIPDDWHYFMQSSIRDMMKFYRGFYPQFNMERYEKLRGVFSLDEKQLIRRLSKGMQKQAAFWIAMCCMPDYLILDEPVDGLDPVMRRQVWSLIMQDVAERGTTVLVSSHNLRELEDVCDHVGIMNKGRVLLERSLSELQDNTVKLQIVFKGEGAPELPTGLNMLHESHLGRVFTIIFRGSTQQITERLAALDPVYMEAVPLPLLNELADYHGVPTVADASYYLLQIGAYGGLVMGAVFGIFFAMAMFAYLTNPRATQGFHSMPVRRETLYATNYLTGLVCMVSALVLAFALAGITAACFGALDLTALGTALLAAVLSVLFFYSFAVLCMMFTGQILAAPVFYGILNFLAVGMEYLVRTFAGNFLYGYSGYSAPETFAFLSPAWELVCVLDVSNVARVDRILSDGTHQVIRGGEYMLSGLGVLGIYAAVGIVLAVLGLLVYRRRASEATGSIVTVAWARPIFKYGVAVCAAFSLGQLIYFLVFGLNLHNGQYSLPGTIACMLFTGLLGYFAAEMLLHKSFRVWRTGRVGALVFSAVLVCFGVAMSLDLTGYESYTPDAEEVEFVSVYLSSNGDYLSCKLDEPESIERTLAAHRAMIADKARQLSYARTTYETPADAPVDSYLYFTVTYALTDGRVVRRSYVDCRAFSRELNEPGSVAQTMTALLNCPEAALDRVLGELADDKSNAYLTGGYYDVVSDGAYGEDDGELTSAQANTLVSALRRDYEAGHASNASLFEDTLYSGSFYVELELWYSVRMDEKPTDRSIDTTSSGSVCAIVTPGMTCTLEALAGMGIETPTTARGF